MKYNPSNVVVSVNGSEMGNDVVDLYTKEVNKKIMNPIIDELEHSINNTIDDLNKIISENEVPHVELSKLPE